MFRVLITKCGNGANGQERWERIKGWKGEVQKKRLKRKTKEKSKEKRERKEKK